MNKKQSKSSAPDSLLTMYRPVLLKDFFLRLLYGDPVTKPENEELIQYFGLEEKLAKTAVAVLRIPTPPTPSGSFHKEMHRRISEEILMDAKKSCADYFESFWLWENINTLVGILIIPTVLTNGIAAVSLEKLAEHMQEEMEGTFESSPVIAMGTVSAGPQEIQTSYENAAELLDYKVLNHFVTPYTYADYKKGEIQFDYDRQLLLTRYIRLGKSREAQEMIDVYLSMSASKANGAVEEIYAEAEKILSTIRAALRTDSEAFEKASFMIDVAGDQMRSISQSYMFTALLTSLIEEVCSAIQIESAAQKRQKVDRLTKYINQNFNRSISLSDLADMLGHSAGYTSRIFKEITGRDILSYISSIRTDHAKTLLISSDMSVAEVGFSVGYDQQQTFIRNFKKITGLTPGEYRKSN